MFAQVIRELKFYYGKIREILNTDNIWDTLATLVKEVENYQSGEFNVLVGDLLRHPVVQGERQFNHHIYTNRLKHMYLTARFAYFLSDKLNFDVRAATRAAMIHDLHSRWFDTREAVAFAKAIGETEEIQEAVKTHMVFFPHPPQRAEGWLLVICDNLALGAECFWTLRYLSRRLILSLLFEWKLQTVTC